MATEPEIRKTLKTRNLFFLVFLCISVTIGKAQNASSDLPHQPLTSSSTDTLDAYVQIDRVFIVGNKKTKEHIIRRELKIHEGQWFFRGDLEALLEEERLKVMNTRLFIETDISYLDLDEHKVDIIVRVLERWYLFPIPIVELGDRNFTEWWTNQDKDLSRLEWGIKLSQFNFRGRNETVNILAQFGYTKRLALGYQVPYIDHNQKIGIDFLANYETNKNTNFQTIDHRLQFVDSEKLLLESFGIRGGISYRPSFYVRHKLGIKYNHNYVKDTIRELNSRYFTNSGKNQRFFSLYYQFVYDKRDYISYPLSGYVFSSYLDQKGIALYDDVNITSLMASYSYYWDLGKGFYAGSGVSGFVSFPEKQPYNLYSGLGLKNQFIRGYEVYVIEGPQYMLNNNSLKFLLFNAESDLRSLNISRKFNKIPFSIYLTTFFDQAYVANYPNYPQNKRFTDTYLYGYGFGIDLVSFYDFVMRFEYSFNKDKESGLRLSINAAF